MNTDNKNNETEQCTIPIVRRSCSCGEKWQIDTNIFIGEHDLFICKNCNGYVTINQIPKGMKFKERLGTW